MDIKKKQLFVRIADVLAAYPGDEIISVTSTPTRLVQNWI
jgi:hypothetical protein